MKSERPPKRPKLKWDPFKRHLLCCLFRFFERDKKQIQEIFSHIVKDHLNQRGIQGLFPFTTLNAQWVWMKSTQHPDWIRVHGDTADGYWSEILADIRSTAKTLKLRLREKASHNDPIGTSSADTHCTNTVSGVRGPRYTQLWIWLTSTLESLCHHSFLAFFLNSFARS